MLSSILIVSVIHHWWTFHSCDRKTLCVITFMQNSTSTSAPLPPYLPWPMAPDPLKGFPWIYYPRDPPRRFRKLSFSLGCTLFLNKRLARTVPINFVLLGVITVTESYILSMLTSQYKPQSVFEIFAMTCAGFIGLSFYAFKSKTDFTIYFGMIYGMSMVFLAAVLLSLFI